MVAVRVMLNGPAVEGVPVSVPTPVPTVDANTTPVGRTPACVMVGVGPPEVVMLNVAIATPTVSVGTAAPDVNNGGAMLTGVTLTGAAEVLSAALFETVSVQA